MESMIHEKIFKRVDGSKVKLTVHLVSEWSSRSVQWKVECYRCEQRKRTWAKVFDDDSYGYRRLSTEQRRKSEMRDILRNVTMEEIREAMRELIAKIPIEVPHVEEMR